MGIGTAQIIVVFLLILLFFGAKRLPEIAKALGKASVEFKKARDEMLATAATPEAPKNTDNAAKALEDTAENKDDQQTV